MTLPPVQRKLDAADVPPERLAGHAKLTEEQKVAEAARQFEAVLLRQILEGTQKTVIRSSLSTDSTASTIYRDMVSHQLADSISRSGALGLARTLEADFLKRGKTSSPDSTSTISPAASPGMAAEPETRGPKYSSPHAMRPDWRATAMTPR